MANDSGLVQGYLMIAWLGVLLSQLHDGIMLRLRTARSQSKRRIGSCQFVVFLIYFLAIYHNKYWKQKPFLN